MGYYIERKSGKKIKEKVAGNKYITWCYTTSMGKSLLEFVIKKKFFSTIYGKFQNMSKSTGKIADFVKEFNIDMSEAVREEPSMYTSFNDFFTRKLKEGSRKIHLEEQVLISPADGKVLAYENIDMNRVVQVKGFFYKLKELFNDEHMAREFNGGTCIVIRLAPDDYHRYHFTDDGVVSKTFEIKGDYYSVNPIALKEIISLYCKNKRHITIFESKNFDKIAYIDVGATCVGSIIQTFEENISVKRGDERGYFKFGGSTVVMFVKKHMVKIDEDIIKNSNDGIETKVYMGEKIGEK